MTASMDDVSELLGGASAFYRKICTRLSERGIAGAEFPISHLAFRCGTFREYLKMRNALEEHAAANVENVWNGRPISKLVLGSALELGPKASVDLIELIPPFHQRVYPMGLEHIGFVVGERVDDFGKRFRSVLSGQQFQSAVCEPYYVRFEDFSHAKFYRHSLQKVCQLENRRFHGFTHADWTPDDLDAGPYPVLSK
ncbi:MAG: VOC family protein [Pseudomonadota bacterium]